MRDISSQGPLVFPITFPNPEATRVQMEKLARGGYVTAANFIPEGLDPKLDALRERQLQLRETAGAELEEVRALAARFAAEEEAADKERIAAKQEQRPEKPVKVTSHEDRRSQRKAIDDRMNATIIVFGEIADEFHAYLLEHGEELLAAQRARREETAEKIRQLENELVDARTDDWACFQTADYIRKNAHAELYGFQPVPDPSEPPHLLNPQVADRMLNAPLTQAVDRPTTPHLAGQAQRAAAPTVPGQVPTLEDFAERQLGTPAGDPTGVVVGLDDQPLEPDVDAGIEKELA